MKTKWKKRIPYGIFLLILTGIAICNVIWAGIVADRLLTRIVRDEKDSQNIKLKVIGEYKEIQVEEEVQLQIRSRKMTEKEKQETLNACRERLPLMILGENENLREVRFSLDLLEEDPVTGVSLQWESDNPALIDEKGAVNCIAAQENPYAVLTAVLTFEDMHEKWQCRVRVLKDMQPEQIRQAIQQIIRREGLRLSQQAGSEALALTEKTPEGITMKWASSSSFSGGFYIFSAAGGCLIIYEYQRRRKTKALAEARHQIEIQFPDFLDKIVIMLYAGLILTDAFERIAADYRTHHSKKNRKILYEEWIRVLEQSRNSNESLAEGLLELGKRWEVKEFTRFTVLAADHLERGNPIADRLLAESELLRKMQKSKAEEMGRLADTKLTFPLMLILLALVVITVAPTMMEMQM